MGAERPGWSKPPAPTEYHFRAQKIPSFWCVKAPTVKVPHVIEPLLQKVRVREPRRVRLWRYYLHRLLPTRHGSMPIAISVFFGVFIGVMPTIGIAIPLTVLCCWLFRTPKIPAVVASFVANPFTQFGFFYPLGYTIGRFLLRPPAIGFDFLAHMETLSMSNFKQVGLHLVNDAGSHLLAFMVGMVPVSVFFALLFAVAAYFGAEYRKKQKQEKRNALIAKTLREN